MKLIFCPTCEDVVRLELEDRRCLCGESSGHYEEDGLHAVISGPAVPLGFDNRDFRKALSVEPGTERGTKFDAFIISRQARTIKVV